MNYNFRLLIMCLLSSSLLCHAMERTNEEKKDSYTITAIKKPRFGQYLTNNDIIIAGEKLGKINLLAKTIKKKKILNQNWEHGDIHPNKKKVLLYNDHMMAIYNLKTNKLEWSERLNEQNYPSAHCICNPLDEDSIFISHHNYHYHDLVQYNYVTDKKKSRSIDSLHHSYRPAVVTDPTQNVLYLIIYKDIYIHTLDDLTLLNAFSLPENNVPASCQYNGDRSLLAVIGYHDELCKKKFNKIFIIEPKSATKSSRYPSIAYPDQEHIEKILFHPNNHVLVILSSIGIHSKDFLINYWNTKTLQLIETEPTFTSDNCHDLAISPNGIEILITLDDKCILLPVPFEVIKDQALRIYWFLKNYQLYQQELPFDVIQLIITKLRNMFTLRTV